MKILILTSRLPYPLEKGDKLRIYHQIRHLSKAHEVSLISISDQPVSGADKAYLLQYCKNVYVFPIKKPGIILSLATGLFSSLPFQVLYFYRRKIKKQIARIVEELQPDRLYCQLIRMAPYVEGLSTAKTLDYMDCFSIGMERRAELSQGLEKFLCKWEAQKLASYEQVVFPLFNSHSIISQQDKEHLPGQYKEKVEIVPNGVDTEYFQAPKNNKPEHDLVFVGNMSYAPNVIAAKYLALRVLPEIRKEKPEATLLLAGASPGKDILELDKNPGVVVGGWYEDVREAYAKGKVFVAPLFSGSGQQNKILEAMAMERPCVSTRLVNNAIQAAEKKEILIAEDLPAFVEQCLHLLDKPQTAKRIGKSSRKFVIENYSWEKSMELLEALFSKSVSITK